MKKNGFILLILVLFIHTISGCTNQTDTPVKEEEMPMDISIAFLTVADCLKNDPVQKYIEDKFHVRFDPVNFSTDNYTSVLQQMSVQNALPDIFMSDIMGTATYENWIQSNKIRSIPKNLNAYPNLSEYLYQPYSERFRHTDGFFYAIPRITYNEEYMWALDRCILVRKDWMQKLGLTPPKNWEEFEHMLSCFVYDDPDGNGIDDTVGLCATHPNTFEAVYLGLFPELSNTERGWIYEDQQWMPVYHSKKTAPALQKIQDLYHKGLVSHNFLYTSGQTELNNFLNGKTGAICMQYYSMVNFFNEKKVLDQAKDLIMVIPSFPAPDGNTYRFTTSLHWSEVYFSTGVNEAKMEKLLEILDWLLSDEFKLITQYGLENTDWKYQDGKPVLLDKNAESPMMKYLSLMIFSRLVSWNQEQQYDDTEANRILFGKENLQNARNLLQWYQKQTMRVNYNYDIIFMSTPAKNNLVSNRYVQQKMFDVIFGSEDANTAWPKALAEIKATTTLEKAVEEVTAEAIRRGITP